jgi:hypothetical protein
MKRTRRSSRRRLETNWPVIDLREGAELLHEPDRVVAFTVYVVDDKRFGLEGRKRVAPISRNMDGSFVMLRSAWDRLGKPEPELS